jgi:hypothetical protein
VALALVAQATSFGNEFTLFALVILPVVLFIGVTTFVRIGRSNSYDAMCVVGMNRIRNAYLQITPEIEPYLVMGAYDDDASITSSMGAVPGASWIVDVLVSTPFVLATINSVIAGTIGAALARGLGADASVAIVLAAAGALIVFVLQVLIAVRGISAEIARYTPKFPPPRADPVDSGRGVRR